MAASFDDELDVPNALEDISRRLETISKTQEMLQTQQSTFATGQLAFANTIAGLGNQVAEVQKGINDLRGDIRGSGQEGGIVTRLTLIERQQAEAALRIGSIEKARQEEQSEALRAKGAQTLWLIGLFATMLVSVVSLVSTLLKH